MQNSPMAVYHRDKCQKRPDGGMPDVSMILLSKGRNTPKRGGGDSVGFTCFEWMDWGYKAQWGSGRGVTVCIIKACD